MQFTHTPLIRALALAVLALSPGLAQAQAGASLTPMPRAQFFDSAGRPLAGGCIESFQSGTSTPFPTYNSASATVANPNPVILDSAGRADIWLSPAQAYRITVRAKTTGCLGSGTVLYSADGILDQGFALVRSIASGTLAIGLRSVAATGAGGGVGAGNALLSATPGGLYVSVNGAAPMLLIGGGGSVTSWNSRTGAVMLSKADVTSVVQALGPTDTPTFAGVISTATGASAAFKQQSGAFQLNGDGKAFFQLVCVNGNPVTEACTSYWASDGTLFSVGLVSTGGATITKSTLDHAIVENDSGGTCYIGTAYAGGISCSSDARLKTAVRNLPDSLALVLKLRPVSFEWSRNKEPGSGFISQEVQALFPGLVHRADDGYLLLDQGGLIPPLVQAIQRLNARVAVLEGKR